MTSGGNKTEKAQTCSESNKTKHNCPWRSASVSGTGDCYSYANAYVYVSDWGGTVEQLTRSNTSCGSSCGDGICEASEEGVCILDCGWDDCGGQPCP